MSETTGRTEWKKSSRPSGVESLLTTKDLAYALGVSESSIKRWADEGVLRAARTVGGHRRVPLAEAIRFVRDRRLALAHAEVLGLSDVAALRAEPMPANDSEALRELLLAGDEGRARGLLQSLFLSGTSVASILDGPVREALREIGELWHHDPAGIALEHRATDVCAQALHRLRSFLPENPDAPMAVGGSLEGDPYFLGSLAAATLLASEGYCVANLGASTPVASLEEAARRLSARLIWVNISSPPEPARVPALVAGLARAVAPMGVQVTVGGSGLDADALPRLPNLHAGRSMAELAAFVRGLASAGSAAGGVTS
ncbi:MAG: B12-binding domain-containing protein [Thermoanaerobaculia bacterium]